MDAEVVPEAPALLEPRQGEPPVADGFLRVAWYPVLLLLPLFGCPQRWDGFAEVDML